MRTLVICNGGCCALPRPCFGEGTGYAGANSPLAPRSRGHDTSYIWTVDSLDADGYVSVFTADAVIEQPGSNTKGQRGHPQGGDRHGRAAGREPRGPANHRARSTTWSATSASPSRARPKPPTSPTGRPCARTTKVAMSRAASVAPRITWSGRRMGRWLIPLAQADRVRGLRSSRRAMNELFAAIEHTSRIDVDARRSVRLLRGVDLPRLGHGTCWSAAAS